MNVDSILLSEYANVTQGKLSVIGVFNRIGPAKLPVQLPIMAVSLVIHAHHDEAGSQHEGELRLIDEKRAVITKRPFRFHFTKENLVSGIPLRAIHTTIIMAPRFDTAGAYAFEVYIGGTYHASTSFVVMEET